eukprot:scaffold2131_cov384-Prasinococcus_capsulatus_cf.AAC.2
MGVALGGPAARAVASSHERGACAPGSRKAHGGPPPRPACARVFQDRPTPTALWSVQLCQASSWDGWWRALGVDSRGTGLPPLDGAVSRPVQGPKHRSYIAGVAWRRLPTLGAGLGAAAPEGGGMPRPEGSQHANRLGSGMKLA